MIDVKDCIGKRVIMSKKNFITIKNSYFDYFSAFILELSPSKTFVRIEIKGQSKWEKVSNMQGGYFGYQIEEILGDIKKS